MTILTAGIDLAKNVFAVHGVSKAGKAELVRSAVPRDKLHELIASPPPCVIVWRPAPMPTTGRGCSRLQATPCG